MEDIHTPEHSSIGWFINLKQWIAYLFAKKWLIVILAAAGGALGIGYAWMKGPKYQSVLTFALEDNGGGLGGAFSLAAEFGINLGSSGKDIFAGENILAIITSRRLVESTLLTVDTFGGKPYTLASYYLNLIGNGKPVKSKSGQVIDFPVGQNRSSFSYDQDSVLFKVFTDITKNDLSATKPDRKLNIYEIKFVSASQQFSKVFSERLIEAANLFYVELRSKRSRETVEILEERAAAMRGAAGAAIKGRASIEDANLNPAFATQGALLQTKQLDATAYGAAYGELFKNLEMARYQYLQNIPLMQVIDEPRLPMKNLKKGRLYTGILFAFFTGLATVIGLILYRFVRLMNSRVSKMSVSL